MGLCYHFHIFEISEDIVSNLWKHFSEFNCVASHKSSGLVELANWTDLSEPSVKSSRDSYPGLNFGKIPNITVPSIQFASVSLTSILDCWFHYIEDVLKSTHQCLEGAIRQTKDFFTDCRYSSVFES